MISLPLKAPRRIDRRRFASIGVSLLLLWGAACKSPFSTPNSDLFKEVDCPDGEEANLFSSHEVTRFLADKDSRTVIREKWANPREPKDINSVPLTKCTVHDEAHWVCNFVGGVYSRSGDVVKSTLEETRTTTGQVFTPQFSTCYEKI